MHCITDLPWVRAMTYTSDLDKLPSWISEQPLFLSNKQSPTLKNVPRGRSTCWQRAMRKARTYNWYVTKNFTINAVNIHQNNYCFELNWIVLYCYKLNRSHLHFKMFSIRVIIFLWIVRALHVHTAPGRHRTSYGTRRRTGEEMSGRRKQYTEGEM